jgi:hypothetical protein
MPYVIPPGTLVSVARISDPWRFQPHVTKTEVAAMPPADRRHCGIPPALVLEYQGFYILTKRVNCTVRSSIGEELSLSDKTII